MNNFLMLTRSGMAIALSIALTLTLLLLISPSAQAKGEGQPTGEWPGRRLGGGSRLKQ